MKYIMACLLAVFSLTTQAMFCPTNFKSINFGDTLEQVLQECGSPTSQKRYKSQEGQAQEWEYYIKSSLFDQGNTKIKFLFKDDKVVNINVVDPKVLSSEVCQSSLSAFGDAQVTQAACARPVTSGEQNLTSTSLCGQSILVGDLSQKVEMACGKPALVKQYEQPGQKDAPEITELRYEGPSGATLLFVNGILNDRQLLAY